MRLLPIFGMLYWQTVLFIWCVFFRILVNNAPTQKITTCWFNFTIVAFTHCFNNQIDSESQGEEAGLYDRTKYFQRRGTSDWERHVQSQNST